MLAFELSYFIRRFLETNDLGMLTGEAGLLKILPGQIRAPDVAFIRWERFPGRKPPKAAIYAIVPDLTVEILSEGNTKAEMDRKLRDYFQAGVQLVWYIEPKTRTARAYTAASVWTEIGSTFAPRRRRFARLRIAAGAVVRPRRWAEGRVKRAAKRPKSPSAMTSRYRSISEAVSLGRTAHGVCLLPSHPPPRFHLPPRQRPRRANGDRHAEIEGGPELRLHAGGKLDLVAIRSTGSRSGSTRR